MYRIFIVFLITSLGWLSLSAQKMTFPADSTAPDGSRSFHGLRIDEAQAVSVSEFAETGISEEQVKLAGKVEDVCQMKGCWMTVKLPDGEKMRITFQDYGFFVPTDASGKTAIMEGYATLDTTSVADLRHFAEDGGMTPEEAAKKYTEPKVEYAFKATGVIIKEE